MHQLPAFSGMGLGLATVYLPGLTWLSSGVLAEVYEPRTSLCDSPCRAHKATRPIHSDIGEDRVKECHEADRTSPSGVASATVVVKERPGLNIGMDSC